MKHKCPYEEKMKKHEEHEMHENKKMMKELKHKSKHNGKKRHGNSKHHDNSAHDSKHHSKHHSKSHVLKPKGKKVTVAKGVKVAHGVEERMRSKKGSSSAGKYKNVAPRDFAGKSGGASAYSFPIPDLAHARNALARAHFAPNPSGIKAKVYKLYPELKKRAKARKSKHKSK